MNMHLLISMFTKPIQVLNDDFDLTCGSQQATTRENIEKQSKKGLIYIENSTHDGEKGGLKIQRYLSISAKHCCFVVTLRLLRRSQNTFTDPRTTPTLKPKVTFFANNKTNPFRHVYLSGHFDALRLDVMTLVKEKLCDISY